jgi:hypothetical protein
MGFPLPFFIIVSRWILRKVRNVSNVEKIKIHILLFHNFFSRKSYRLWDDVEKYGTARQATDDDIIQLTRFTCWIPRAVNTHSEHVLLLALPRQLAARTRLTLPVLLQSYISISLDQNPEYMLTSDEMVDRDHYGVTPWRQSRIAQTALAVAKERKVPNSIGSSRPIKTSKNFNSKTKFNKLIPLRQSMPRQAIRTRSQCYATFARSKSRGPLPHKTSLGRPCFKN